MHYSFPINFVYWQSVHNHKQIKSTLLKQILSKKDLTESKKPNGWKCEINTSFEMGYEFNEFLLDSQYINNIIWNPIDSMLDEFNPHINQPKSSFITNAWYNIYTEDSKDQYQEIHDHLSSSIVENGKEYFASYSAIYILHNSKKENSTVFFSSGPHTGKDPLSNIYFDTSEYDTIGEGSVLIFPAHLKHYVKPCFDNRVTISYNIYSEL